MITYISKFENASKMQIRDEMVDIEMKLRRLRHTPYSGTAVDKEIDREIDYMQEVHDELLRLYRSSTDLTGVPML